MFKARHRLGKYRIERKLAEGGFGIVYQALDTIEGVRVALKVPYPHLVDAKVLDDFRHEVRLAARLDHVNILPLKNAAFIEGHFVMVFALGEQTLDERLRKRMALRTALDLGEQMLEAVACAHQHRIIHCDIKPDNLLLFPGGRLRLTDFGIAKVAQRTIRASGSGTVGYIAPEQAMGRPSFHSDVFSMGLVLYRMLVGTLPEWPYDWPPPGLPRQRARLHPDLIEVLRKAIEMSPAKRFADAGQMLAAYRKVKGRALRFRSASAVGKSSRETKRDWRTVRRKQFQRQYGQVLETRFKCQRCHGPVAENMQNCPWCGKHREVHRDSTRFPAQCPRCQRGIKLDWEYCAWCYGPGFEVPSTRKFSDVRYEGRCSSPGCERKVLMPFMRYCPWCHRKVRKKWLIPGSSEKCSACGWGLLGAYWSFCPWCGKSAAKH